MNKITSLYQLIYNNLIHIDFTSFFILSYFLLSLKSKSGKLFSHYSYFLAVFKICN